LRFEVFVSTSFFFRPVVLTKSMGSNICGNID
jgi:hypothetical protein